MDIGKIGVVVGLVASITAIVLYALSLRGGRRLLWAARGAYAATALSVLFCFGRLMYLVSHHRFEYNYVWKYSSADLGWPWNYAATWAGQEGSFLLWAFWTAVIGALIVWKGGKWESRVMPFYISTLAFLFGILVWLSPYNVIPRGTGPNDYPLALPWPPQNGMGLNPALQNYWMAIHPPTIFFGFSSLLVPFAFALAAMIWRDYQSWAQRVMPFVLMTVATLGVGLFMGGYWAYETQGWHGFWGWDPVENASLFPWLGTLGLLHGLVVQKSRGGMGRSNIFLSIVSWLLFLYGTFLTRSGVLADFSVHAFDMLGKSALQILLWMIAIHGLGGFALLAWRWRTIPGRAISDRVLSRDTAMVIAVSLMMMGAAVVAIGTSWPLLSRLPMWKSMPLMSHYYAAKGMAVQPSFYNKFGSSVIIPALIIMGMVPFLAWGKTNAEKFLWKVLAPWLLAVGGGVLVLWFVWNQEAGGFRPSTPRMLVVVIAMLGLFAALANIVLAVKLLRVKAVTMGGWLAHVGIGVLMLGTVLTNVYEQTPEKPYLLVEGNTPVKTPFGYSLQFAGWTHDGKSPEEINREWSEFGHALKIRVVPTTNEAGVVHADDNSSSTADDKDGYTAYAPVFRQHNLQMNQGGDDNRQYMCWPSIHKEWTRDTYLLVVGDPQILRPSATVREGDTEPIGIEGLGMTDYTVTYKRFYMHGAPGQPGTAFGAEMVLHTPDGRNIPIQPEERLTESGMEPTVVQIPGVNGVAFMQGGINAATREMTVAFELPEAPGRWVAFVSVTNKPMINLVWSGVLLMGLGTLCAMVRRALEARKGALIANAASAGVEDFPTPVAVSPVADNGIGGNGKNGHGNGSGGKARSRRAARVK